ncbi:unnamed protein product [Closterium sp. NIES-53]
MSPVGVASVGPRPRSAKEVELLRHGENFLEVDLRTMHPTCDIGAPLRNTTAPRVRFVLPVSVESRSLSRDDDAPPVHGGSSQQRHGDHLVDLGQSMADAAASAASSEGFGFESQCVHFGHPSAGGCQRSTGDPRLIIGKGYRLVVMGGYGRTYPLLNKPFYPNGLVVGILTSWPHSSLRGVSCRGRRLRRGGRRHHWPRSRVAPHLRAAMPVVQVVLDCQVLVIVLAVLVRLHFAGTCVRPSVPRFLQSFRGVVAAARSIQTVLRECRDVDMFIHNEGRRLSLV